MKNFVTPAWLSENSQNKGIVILDARAELTDPEAGLRHYKNGHIKGAQFVSLENTMSGIVGKHGGRHPLPDMKVFIETMQHLGVDDSSTVVVYDDGSLSMAGRLWWLLKYAGKDKVFVLKGGMREWLKNDFDTTKEVIEPQVASSLRLSINSSMLVEMPEVIKAIEDSSKAIIDSRAKKRYIGEIEPMDSRPGHIPSALNYPWKELIADEIFPSQSNIQNKFDSLTKYEKIIVHCGSGITGTVNMLFMDELGLDSSLYLGGYSDWVSYDENPVVLGEQINE